MTFAVLEKIFNHKESEFLIYLKCGTGVGTEGLTHEQTGLPLDYKLESAHKKLVIKSGKRHDCQGSGFPRACERSRGSLKKLGGSGGVQHPPPPPMEDTNRDTTTLRLAIPGHPRTRGADLTHSLFLPSQA